MISIKWTGKRKMGRAGESHDMSHILHIGKNPLDSWTGQLGLIIIIDYNRVIIIW